MKKHKKQKGFTLIELLVVIAIIAILAVVVVLTLNPAELLRQARDSNRISDFATLKSALALYSIDVATTTSMDGVSVTGGLFTADASMPNWSTSSSAYTATSSAGSWGFVQASSGPIIKPSRVVDGTGWIPVDLDAIDSGAPLNVYPVDPVNSGTSNAYIYEANITSWKIATNMESAKYSTGPNNVLSTDGGTSDNVYEQGSNLAL
jgi:prepilin-type N-terminal cleavage/methylation domain-containing protein